MEDIIELRDVTRLYRTGSRTVRALDRVSLSVKAGIIILTERLFQSLRKDA